MVATRKLQIEIERTLKKVQQALDDFRATWGKMDDASESSKKDKCEGELKKEIKRLQRDREQIRSWLSSQEGLVYRDGLESVKRDIEAEMERFKILEKCLKVKAFSKEGLILQPHIDPQEQAKMDAVHFLNRALDSLQLLIDTCEAEVETKSAGKGAKRCQPRILELETQISKHKWHRTKLEQILRLLANEETSTEEVDFLRDSLDYYVQSHQDGEIADFCYDDALYDSFPFERLSMSQREIGEDVSSYMHSLPSLDSIEEEDMAPITPTSSAEGVTNPFETKIPSRTRSSGERDVAGGGPQAARPEVISAGVDLKEPLARELFKSPGLDDLATLQNDDSAASQTDQETASQSPLSTSLTTSRPPSLPTSPIKIPKGPSLKSSPESSSPTRGSGSGSGRNCPVYLPPNANSSGGNRPLASQVVRGGDSAPQHGSGVKPLPPKSLFRQFSGISPSHIATSGPIREVATPNVLPLSMQAASMHSPEGGSGIDDEKVSTKNVPSVFEKLSRELSTNEMSNAGMGSVEPQSGVIRGPPMVPPMTTSQQPLPPKSLVEDVSRDEGENVGAKQEGRAPSSFWGGQDTIIERPRDEAHAEPTPSLAPTSRAPSTSTSSPIVSSPATWNLEQRVQEHHQRMHQHNQELPTFSSLGFKPQERPSLQNSPFLHDRTFLYRPPHPPNDSTTLFAPHQHSQPPIATQFPTRFTPHYMPQPFSSAHQFPPPDMRRYGPLEFDWCVRSSVPPQPAPHTSEHASEDALQSEEGVGGDQRRAPQGWQPLFSRFRQVEMQAQQLAQGEPSKFPNLDPMTELERLGVRYKDPPTVSPSNIEEAIGCLARGAVHVDTSRAEAAELTTRVAQAPSRPCQVPNSWPHHAIAPEHAPALFKRLNTESLFFAYYFQQKSHAQFLAIKELQSKSWRYHKQYRTWFQRHAEPVEVKEEFERGSYLYFDFELHREKDASGWCQKIKPNMMFEYRFLEEELKS